MHSSSFVTVSPDWLLHTTPNKKPANPPKAAAQQRCNSLSPTSRAQLTQVQLERARIDKQLKQEDLVLLRQRSEREAAKHVLEMEILKLQRQVLQKQLANSGKRFKPYFSQGNAPKVYKTL